MKKLKQWCKAHDKRAHFYVAFLLAQIILILLPFTSLEFAFGYSTLLSYTVFFGKELYDQFFGTGFDWNDIFVDFVGWLGGTMLSSISLMAYMAIFK